jgi:hypothetical protein
MADPKCAMLIKEGFPEAKIIFSYRNPVDSIYSYYYQIGREFPVPETFEKFLEEQPHFIQMGFYYTHTKRFLERFPLRNLHFILYDDICTKPRRVITDLYEFLGIRSSFLPGSLHRKVNTRMSIRSVVVRNFIGNTRDLLNSKPWLKGIKRILMLAGLHHLSNRIYVANLRASRLPPMQTHLRTVLTQTYAEEITLLSGLLNRDLSHWFEFNIHEQGPTS